mgnify:CR=1 FL=1
MNARNVTVRVYLQSGVMRLDGKIFATGLLMNSILRVVSVSGGKDSTATALLCQERFPEAEIRRIFCDVGNEHALTYEYLDYLEQRLGPITRLKADFTDAINAKRARLKRIADGEEVDTRGKYHWTPETAREAIQYLVPTGNPFLDLCLSRGMFPSHGRQFCTEELKRNPMVEYQMGLIDEGYQIESWQGVRADESPRRANLAEREDVGGGMTIYRPILRWTGQQAIDFTLSKGLRVNDLYLMGMDRVGCMPCINVNKDELLQIALRFPEEIERIHQWELLAKRVAKSCPTWLHSGDVSGQGIYKRVEWAKTGRGGKQFDMFRINSDPLLCESAYGLCE